MALVDSLGGLCLAAAALAQPAAATDDWRYRVQPGDTPLTLSEDWLDGRYGWRICSSTAWPTRCD
jgi:hypothetical protein